MNNSYVCYFCRETIRKGAGHAATCETHDYLGGDSTVPPPRCDCGSPAAHWQFCRVFVPYEQRSDK